MPNLGVTWDTRFWVGAFSSGQWGTVGEGISPSERRPKFMFGVLKQYIYWLL